MSASPLVDKDRALLALAQHPSWQVLREEFEEKLRASEQALGKALIEKRTFVDETTQAEAYGYWRGVFDVFKEAEKAIDRLSRGQEEK